MIFQEERTYMNGWTRLSSRLHARRAGRGLGSGAERDERSLARHMRALAVQLRVDGRARLTCPASLAAQTQALAREAGGLMRESTNATPALTRLHQDARLMEACATQARLDGGVRLPAVGRVPRLLVLMREVVALGDTALSGERLLLALRAFDDVQALTMAELWAVPTALRRALSEAFCHGGRATLERARERRAAERFVEAEDGAGRMGGSPAFFERALQLTVERELPGVRARLEERMAQLGESGEPLTGALQYGAGAVAKALRQSAAQGGGHGPEFGHGQRLHLVESAQGHEHSLAAEGGVAQRDDLAHERKHARFAANGAQAHAAVQTRLRGAGFHDARVLMQAFQRGGGAGALAQKRAGLARKLLDARRQRFGTGEAGAAIHAQLHRQRAHVPRERLFVPLRRAGDALCAPRADAAQKPCLAVHMLVFLLKYHR